ncbi:MAG: tyrosine-protein phosphatase [Frankia sp.]|nr:tyrosine-protein phosphatase [Frankia sp.]
MTLDLRHPTDADSDDRVLDLPGALNLRDVGGYPAAGGRRVRRRTLLRSAALHGLGDEARAALAQLPLRTVIDLREEPETEREPNALGSLPVNTVRLPVYSAAPLLAPAKPAAPARPAAPPASPANPAAPAASDGREPGSGAAALDGARTALASGAGRELADIYDFLLDQRGEGLAAAVRALAAPGALPAIVHCSAGKDRTGLVIMLVLDLLGVPDEVIAQDYARTADLLHDEAVAAIRRLGAVVAGSAAGSADEDENLMPAHLMDCPPELILRSLARVRDGHGGARGYLLAHGATAAELDQLTAALLVDGAEPVSDAADQAAGA